MNEHLAFARSGLRRVAIWSAQLGQPSQRRAAPPRLGRLPREAAGGDPLTTNRLEPKHRGLRQAAPMIPTLAFPGGPPHLPKAAQVLIARQPFSLGLPMLPNLGVGLGRNRGPRVAGTDGLVTLPFVIAPLARYLLNLLPPCSSGSGKS